MELQRTFLSQLYENRKNRIGVDEIPYIELFQNDKELRNYLYQEYITECKKFSKPSHIVLLDIMNSLATLSVMVKTFKESVFENDYKELGSMERYAKVFSGHLTDRVRKIKSDRLTSVLLHQFINDDDIYFIKGQIIANKYLKLKHDNSYKWESNYLDLKGYANDFIKEFLKIELDESTVGLSSAYDEELTDVVNELDPIYDAEGRSLALYYLFINEKVTRGNAQKKLKVSKNNSTQKFLEYYKEYEDYYNNVSTLCNSKNRKQIFALRKIYRNTKELLVYKEFSTKEVDSALSIIETFILDN
ncbi:hypothetical protein [Maribacter sp. Hel_I_7]|uniref:hypothetical protein n=1 Tax=Maribacter sp. Hel_I_7 TaxID=1249997 RepID=UPI00047EA975|nr:hypothetical protein [Maribacter sp. Hel_I_7]